MEEAPQGQEGPSRPRPAQHEAPHVFEVRVTGLVPEGVLDDVANVTIVSQDLRTSLRGSFRDQAELHGLLATLRALGLDVVEIRRLAGPPDVGGTVAGTAGEEA
jgi:hypothetical protein